MLNASDLKNQLGATLPFLTKEPSLMEEALREGRPARLEGGQFICMEGSVCAALPVVLEGTARIYKMGESGREITLYRLGAGDSCILTASCILNENDFPAFAVTEDALEAFLIPPSVLRRWVRQHDAWREYVFDLMSHRLHALIAVVEEVVFRRLDVRLAAYLSERIAGLESPTLHTTHESIAYDLGSSREVVSRLLKEFEHEGLLTLGRGSIHVRDTIGLQSRGRPA